MRAELFSKTELMRAGAWHEYVALTHVSLGIQKGFFKTIKFKFISYKNYKNRSTIIDVQHLLEQILNSWQIHCRHHHNGVQIQSL